MARRRGLRSEVLLSLALLMGTAILVLGALLLGDARIPRASAARARGPLAARRRALAAAAASGERAGDALVVGGRRGRASRRAARAPARSTRRRGSWRPRRVRRDGRCCARGGPGRRFDSRRPSGPRKWRWRGCRRSRRPACSRACCSARSASSRASAPTSCAGAWCCPLEQLAGAARAIGAGELGARAPVEGTREIAEVAQAFNAMTEALARRSEALEKAVADLRESNRAAARDARRAGSCGAPRRGRAARRGRRARGREPDGRAARLHRSRGP